MKLLKVENFPKMNNVDNIVKKIEKYRKAKEGIVKQTDYYQKAAKTRFNLEMQELYSADNNQIYGGEFLIKVIIIFLF